MGWTKFYATPLSRAKVMGMPNPEETTREWLIGSELAERWQLPERTIEQWRYLGKGPPYHRFGRHVRYRRADVEAFEAEQVVAK